MTNPVQPTLNIIAIVTDDNVFITEDNQYTYNTLLKHQYFCNEKYEFPEKTYKQGWYKLTAIPTKIINVTPQSTKSCYKLKPEVKNITTLPEELSLWDMDEDNEDCKYHDLIDCFELVTTTIPEKITDIDFNINIIAKRDKFEIIKEEFKVKYNKTFIEELLDNPILDQEKPCTISSSDLYTLIRKEIVNRIDPKIAKITSNYDFCFTVEKIIPLDEPVNVKINIAPITAKKAKYKIIKKYTKELVVFEMAPKPYNAYPVIQPIQGKNYNDLHEKVFNYIDNLIEKINEPIKKCSCCNGVGYIINKE